jgi:TRAP-type C4-dicarboxylate transport system permease small subunit
LSDGILRVERGAVRLLAFALPLMIIANTIGRAFRSPIYFMDELAIHCMVWIAMIGMSLTLKTRTAVSVTMLVDAVPLALMKSMKVLIDVIILTFAGILIYLCIKWFDPVALARVGFDFQEFSGETFTLGMKKFWFWLIVPVAAMTTFVHALSNLLKTAATPAAALKELSASSGARGLD